MPNMQYYIFIGWQGCILPPCPLGNDQGGFLSRKKLMKGLNLMPHSYFQKSVKDLIN